MDQKPLVLVGTFTGLNNEGKPIGEPVAYRVCLVLADLKTGKTVAKGTARALPGGFDTKPLPYFADSPTWRKDQRVEGYIKTCQGTQPGSPIDPAYLDGVQTAALVSKGVDAYNAGEYQQALDYYNSARQTSAGDQLRVYNGIYMAYWKLDQRDRAEEAFGEIVDYGLRNDRLGRQVPLQAGIDRVLARPGADRALPALAAPDRAAECRPPAVLPGDRRPHQPYRSGGPERASVTSAR